MGYADPDAPVNQTAMRRERVQDFARLVGFPERNPIPLEEHPGRLLRRGRDGRTRACSGHGA